MIDKLSKLTDEEVTKIINYTGYILLSYELVKSMIVKPIKFFYDNTTFTNMPFNSYENDVLARHNNEFEACLLYLKDFMKAINASDFQTIQKLRKHRNDLAHNLPERLSLDTITKNSKLLIKSKEVIFKLSNYIAYIEVGQEPNFQGVDWSEVKGNEYLILEAVIKKVKYLD